MPRKHWLLIFIALLGGCSYTALQYEGPLPYPTAPTSRYVGTACSHNLLYVIPVGDGTAVNAAKNLRTDDAIPSPIPEYVQNLKMVELGVQRYFWLFGYSTCAVVRAERR